MRDVSPKRDIGVVDAAYNLPGAAVDVERWPDASQVAPEVVREVLAQGCRYFHACGSESDADLVSAAIDKLAVRRARELADVRYLVHAHTLTFSVPAPPDSLLTEIIRRHSLAPKLSFSISHVACASTITAIDWAARLLSADDDARYALVVTSDRSFGGAEYRLSLDAGIQSDGGSAILLGKDDVRCWLGAASYKNVGGFHEGPADAAAIARIARYAWVHTKSLLKQHSAEAGIALEDYGQLLPINDDRRYWTLIAKALRVPADSFFLDNIHARGHACSTDLAVNLVDRGFALLDEGKPVAACGQSNIGAYAALTLLPTSVPSCG